MKKNIIDARPELGTDFWMHNYIRLIELAKPTKNACLLRSNGTKSAMSSKKLKLPDLYDAMDCHCVDVVNLPAVGLRGPMVLIVDDNGLLSEGAEINPLATAIVNCLYGGKGNPIVGSVVIADAAQF